MILNPNFEVTEVAGEYMAIPVGEVSHSFNGVIALNEAAAFVLNQIKTEKTESELINALVAEYNVDYSQAKNDIQKLIDKLKVTGIIIQ